VKFDSKLFFLLVAVLSLIALCLAYSYSKTDPAVRPMLIVHALSCLALAVALRGSHSNAAQESSPSPAILASVVRVLFLALAPVLIFVVIYRMASSASVSPGFTESLALVSGVYLLSAAIVPRQGT